MAEACACTQNTHTHTYGKKNIKAINLLKGSCITQQQAQQKKIIIIFKSEYILTWRNRLSCLFDRNLEKINLYFYNFNFGDNFIIIHMKYFVFVYAELQRNKDFWWIQAPQPWLPRI